MSDSRTPVQKARHALAQSVNGLGMGEACLCRYRPALAVAIEQYQRIHEEAAKNPPVAMTGFADAEFAEAVLGKDEYAKFVLMLDSLHALVGHLRLHADLIEQSLRILSCDPDDSAAWLRERGMPSMDAVHLSLEEGGKVPA